MSVHPSTDVIDTMFNKYIWLRYVDDTFTVLQEGEVEQFTQHLNSMDDIIKFTVEVEQNNTPASLDTCICLKDDGSTKVKVYRKATHTDQYLNLESIHPLENKRSVVRTLLERAERLTSQGDVEVEPKKVLSPFLLITLILHFVAPPKLRAMPTKPCDHRFCFVL